MIKHGGPKKQPGRNYSDKFFVKEFNLGKDSEHVGYKSSQPRAENVQPHTVQSQQPVQSTLPVPSIAMAPSQGLSSDKGGLLEQW